MRFARGDMRDHIVSHKNDHGASYRRYRVLQCRSRLKINFCEIFGVVQFSTFATKSAQNGPPAMSELCPLSGVHQTSHFEVSTAAFDPQRHLVSVGCCSIARGGSDGALHWTEAGKWRAIFGRHSRMSWPRKMRVLS